MADGSEGPSFERLHMIPAGGAVVTAEKPAPERPRARRARRLLDLAIVVATLLGILYFGLVASDHYESAASFVVRSPGNSVVGQLAGGPERPVVVRSIEDAHVVRAYLTSRDAIQKLAAEAGIAALYARPEVDVLSRYPGFLRSESDERLFKYLRRMIDVEIDKRSGVSHVTVRAFRPEDARLVVEAMIRNAESVVNSLGAPQRRNALAAAEATLEEARKEVETTQVRLEDFRKENRIIDPTLTWKAESKRLSAMALEAAEVRVKADELMRNAPNSPQLPSLKRRLAAVEEQAEIERTRLTGGDATLGRQIGDYERLILDRTLAEKAFQLSEAALDVERVESHRQRYFLDMISRPSLPDYPTLPGRLFWMTLVALLGAVLLWVARQLPGLGPHGAQGDAAPQPK